MRNRTVTFVIAGIVTLFLMGAECGGNLPKPPPQSTQWVHAVVTWTKHDPSHPIEIDYSYGDSIDYTAKETTRDGKWDILKPLKSGQDIHVLVTHRSAGLITCTMWEATPLGDHIGNPVAGPLSNAEPGGEVHCIWQYVKGNI